MKKIFFLISALNLHSHCNTYFANRPLFQSYRPELWSGFGNNQMRSGKKCTKKTKIAKNGHSSTKKIQHKRSKKNRRNPSGKRNERNK